MTIWYISYDFVFWETFVLQIYVLSMFSFLKLFMYFWCESENNFNMKNLLLIFTCNFTKLKLKQKTAKHVPNFILSWNDIDWFHNFNLERE